MGPWSWWPIDAPAEAVTAPIALSVDRQQPIEVLLGRSDRIGQANTPKVRSATARGRSVKGQYTEEHRGLGKGSPGRTLLSHPR